MTKENELAKSNIKVRVYVVVLVSILFLVLVSYGYFYVSKNQADDNTFVGGCFNTTFTDGDSISIENAVPMNENEGQSTNPYNFTLTNTCDKPIKYYVILNVKNNSFNSKFINVSTSSGYSQRLDTVPTNTMDGTIDQGYTQSYILKTGMLDKKSITENIKLWLNDGITVENLNSESNSSFTAKIKVKVEVAQEYKLATTKIKKIVEGEPTNTTDVITKEAPDGASCTNTLAYDGTVDNNLRYVGSNPCNYASFNNESWRIIGVMNNIDDGTGNKETRIKIAKNGFINSYSWDSSANEINSGKGINDWTQADLMRELNGDYLDTTLTANTMWYRGSNNSLTGAYTYTFGLSAKSQELIGNAKWSLGGYNSYNVTAGAIYGYERGTSVWGSENGEVCNDGACPRATSWTGKVALPYPSDYGLAVGGDARTRCLTIDLVNYISSCNINTFWRSSSPQWLLTPYSTNSFIAHYINSNGALGFVATSGIYFARPTAFLNSSAIITGGNGSAEDPYVFG